MGQELSTNFNRSPYFDDFDAMNNYLRILFRPGRPVQARELTQLQSILNNQVSNLGESIYEDGTLVFGGEVTLEELDYITLDEEEIDWDQLKQLIVPRSLGRNYRVNDRLLLRRGDDEAIVTLNIGDEFSVTTRGGIIPEGFFGRILTTNFDTASGAEGARFEVNRRVTTMEDPGDDPEDNREDRPIFLVKGFTTRTSTDAPTIYGEYLTGDEFKESDTLILWDEENEVPDASVSFGQLGSDFTGESLFGTIEESIFFIHDFFVRAHEQMTVISKYSTDASARFGYDVIERILDSRDEPSLLDNAAGFPNENAPGADRFLIDLIATAKIIQDDSTDIENNANEDFYEIARIVDGDVVDRQETEGIAEIENEMARQLYDVNGNFIVEPFELSIGEKKLFQFHVDSHSRGSTTADVTINRSDIDREFIEGRQFWFNDIPIEITTAVDLVENDEQLTASFNFSNLPSFMKLEGENINVYDESNFQTEFSPGRAYVRGYPFANIGKVRRDLEKTTTEQHVNTEENETINVSFGNYLVLGEHIEGQMSDTVYRTGNRVLFYGDEERDTEIGESRLMQLRRSDNDRFELYFFDSKFNSFEITNVNADVESDPRLITSNDIEKGHNGCRIKINNVRYRIVNVDDTADPVEATLDSNLGTDLNDETASLSFSNRNIKSVNIAPDEYDVQFIVSETVQRDRQGNGYEETRVLGTEDRRLIFNLYDERPIESLQNTQFRYYRQTNSEVSNDEITVDLGSNEVLHGDTSEYLIYLANDGRFLDASEILSTSGNAITVDDSISDQDVNVSYPVINLNTTSIPSEFVYGNTYNTSLAEYVTDSEDEIDDPGDVDRPNGQVRIPAEYIRQVGVGNEFSIGLSFVTKVRAIYELADKDEDDIEYLEDGPHRDITDHFRVNTGQYESHVDHTKLSLIRGFDYPDRPILVVVDRIVSSTSVSASQRFYSPDSYSDLDYIKLPEIFTESGDDYKLERVVDFRPRARELQSGIDFREWNEREDKEYRQVSTQPDAADDNLLITDISYYQPRIDKVIITSESELKIDQGDPDDDPSEPSDRDDSITIYTIMMDGFSDDRSEDVETKMHDHRRFRMPDIRNIEDRVKQIEEEMQSDQLEQDILSEEITDRNNTDLLKTGTLADSFTDQDKLDAGNPDFNASVDTDEGFMRPPYDQVSFEIEADEDESGFNALLTDENIIMAPILGSKPFVDQPIATRTMNVNSSGDINWKGTIKLDPEKDNWQDTIRKPEKVTDISGDKRAYDFIEDNVPSRTSWNSWEKDWSARSNTTRTETRTRGSWWWKKKEKRKTTTERGVKTRTGVKESVSFEQKKESMGDKVKDTKLIPKMRSTPGGIEFLAEEFKPRTNLYPFFADENIIEYIRPGIVFEVPNNEESLAIYNDSRTRKNKTPVVITYNGDSVTTTYTQVIRGVNKIYFHFVPDDRNSFLYDIEKGSEVHLEFKTTRRLWTFRRRLWSGGPRFRTIRTTYAEINAQLSYQQKIDGQYRLRTDMTGCVSGIFDVPEDTFSTGTNEFKLIDNVQNDDSQATTNASVDFRAQGIEKTVQETFVSTRVPKIEKQNLEQSQKISRTRSTGWKGTNPPKNKSYNPLAMTYFVDSNDFPHGLFVHSIDIWFQNRDLTQPVKLEMRPTQNGYPDKNTILPFSEVTLYPDEVTIDEAPQLNSYTRFTFSSPIYLEPGEYSFALKANSNMYEVFGAVMGDNVLERDTGLAGDKIMNKQPYSGVLFKSSNASTWKPYNNENLMFRINRAQFETGEYTAYLKTIFDNEQIRQLSPYKREDRYYHYDDAGEEEVDEDGYGTSFFAYNLLKMNMQSIEGLEETEDPIYEMVTAKYDETNFQATRLPFEQVEENENHPFTRTRIIREDQQGEDLKFRVRFRTDTDHISPTLDVLKSSVILIQNIIDDMRLVPDRHITIEDRGTGYEVGNRFDLVPYDFDGTSTTTGDSTIIGSVFVDEVDENGGIQALKNDENNIPKWLTDRYKLVPRDGAVDGNDADFEVASEWDSAGGVTQAKYITKTLELDEDFESQDLFVSFRTYRPSGVRFYVYYKVKSPGDSEPFERKPWVKMYERTNPDRFSEDQSDYIKLKFVTYRERSDGSVDDDTKGGTFYEVDGTEYGEFNQYQVKVVMASETLNRVPRVQNLGATSLIDPIEPLED